MGDDVQMGRQPRCSPARREALRALEVVRARDAYASQAIAATVDRAELSSADRAFATRLVLGVVSCSGTLDEVIDRCLRSSSDIKPDVRNALRVSTYEVVFLEKAPHAAVDQGVELVRAIAPKAGSLANAVLRKIVKCAASFPFGDPETDDAALARQHAFPLWLAKVLIRDLGREEAARFMEVCNEPAALFLAENLVGDERSALSTVFARLGHPLEEVRLNGALVDRCRLLDRPRMLLEPHVASVFSSGRALVSDAGAQRIAQMAVPPSCPGSFLEVGSGRGTKTILMQNEAYRRFGRQMPLTAIDAHRFKADILKKRLAVFGIDAARIMTCDARKLATVFSEGAFDAVFIDAPCSGLGTLRRHPEIRWRLRATDIDQLAQLDLDMLVSAARCVKRGGMLTYATCTVLRQENEHVVKRFLKGRVGQEFAIDAGWRGVGESAEPLMRGSDPSLAKPCFRTKLASGGCDAHFAVRLVREGSW